MEKMNVAMYYNNKDIRIEKIPIPEINDNEILVKVIASGICGSDVMEWYRIKKAPLVLGHEIAGDIIKVGKKVTKFKVGDRIFATHHVPCNECEYCKNNKQTICETIKKTKYHPGGFAEYLKIPSINIKEGTFLLPKEISYDEGTFIEPLACVVRGLKIARFKPGKSVLILGSGIAGLLNIKLAKAYGASKIFSTDVEPNRLKMAKKNGAILSIDAKENIPEKIMEYNNGKLAELVILCVGIPSALEQAINSVEKGGTILLFAPTKPEEKIPIDVFNLWNKQVNIVSTYAAVKNDIIEAINLIKYKKIDINDMITHKLPLKEAQNGFELVRQAKDSIKVILEPHKK